MEGESCTKCSTDVDLREMSRRTGHTVQAELISSLERRSIVTKLFLQVTVPRPRVYCYQIVLNLFVNDLTVFTIQTTRIYDFVVVLRALELTRSGFPKIMQRQVRACVLYNVQ